MEQAITDARVRDWEFQLAISAHRAIMGDPIILNETVSEDYAGRWVDSARFQENEKPLGLLDAQMLVGDPGKGVGFTNYILLLLCLDLT